MEVTGVENGWIARIDGVGEHYKATCANENAAKHGCIEAARSILHHSGMHVPDSIANPEWN